MSIMTEPNPPEANLATADASEQDTVRSEKQSVSGAGVTDMITDLSDALEAAIEEIHSVNAETKVLALNARIEAARAGSYGAAFSVVAEEMQQLSEKTSQIANDMASRTRDKTTELMTTIGSSIRGTRLSDLALVNVDLIDRNLYERTCDVRWWATDPSLVSALSENTSESAAYASQRLGVILKAYTVYFDLVLCDASGKVIANGKPESYSNVGADMSRASWFTESMQSRSGDDYGFQSAHASSLAKGQPALIYSCAVRENGETNGNAIGSLGIVFNWEGLSKPIVEDIPVSPQELPETCAYIVNRESKVLASNRDYALGDSLNLPNFDEVLRSDKGFFTTELNGREVCVGHARAPGFETYSTDWYSIVTQPLSS